MKWRDYLSSKAIVLCFFGMFAIGWGVFAYLAGATPLLLGCSESVFVCTVAVRYTLGYLFTNRKLKKLHADIAGLEEKYLLGELIELPRDATEREYYEIMREVSRAAIGAAETAKREKEEYLASVEKWIHEIKTPLTACSLICDNGCDETKLRRELKRADNLTDTILQYARLRTSETDTAISRVSIAEIIDSAIKSQREILLAAKVSVCTQGDFTAHTDGKAVEFVIRQFLINCAKYCKGGQVAFSAQNGILTVSDNGPGIAAHELPRIFDRGFTGETGKKTGTGMGLYIVSEICKRLDISLSVSSQPSEGTVFTLSFP